MKGLDFKIFLIVIVIAFLLGYIVFDKKYDEYSNIITFLSIMIGFKITSLSIIFNSALKKSLYDRKNKDYGTELHRLKDFYKHSIYFEVASITILFLVTSEYKYIFVMPIIIGTIYCFYKTTNELLKIFIHPTNEK
ncbi:hypothetical protein [Arcobacter lacus]|uniref:Uncharacterized protein n=1 Tax=Arcobacter lacus TaxID=1912876 RepID=A0ABX5JIJ0_9BACT|nr:hypothetical protein [Arcobacter lacus]PUE66220.1 hypothetical protein B0175_05800 [Arcobacter lacus]